MASLFKQSITRPLPAGAELFTRNGERFARWTVRGKVRTAHVTGEDDAMRIRIETGTWYARLRAADGSRVDVSTGCRDKSAAASRLAELVAEQEKIRGGIITQNEANTAKHGRALLSDVCAAFVATMTARGCAADHIKKTGAYLTKAADALGWKQLCDMNRAELERWLSMRAVTPKDETKPDSLMGARVHNAYATAFKAFGAWCVRQGYTKLNTFTAMVKRSEKADRRHIRRALTADELARLIAAAAARPLLEASKINRGPDKGKPGAELSDTTRERLRFLGWTRAMAYWTAAGTGLRWGELRSITLGAVRLDADIPHLLLEAKHEKARRGAQIPLQADVVAELRMYIAERRSRLVGHSSASVVEFPGALDGAVLFDVPESMAKIFDADCAAAGIVKHDGAGRVVDVHALRHTFGTMLAKAGVSLQVAQKAMRHSTPVLTANVYTHLGLLDVAGALDKLPGIGATVGGQHGAEKVANSVTPDVTPDSDIPSHSGVTKGNIAAFEGHSITPDTHGVLAHTGKALRGGATKLNGGPGRTRTYDQVIMSHTIAGCNDSDCNALENRENSVTPDVTPETQKAAIVAALRGMSADELRALLVDVLAGQGESKA